MVLITNKNGYKNIKLVNMDTDETIKITLTKRPYVGKGKYGEYLTLTGTYNGEEVSILVGNTLKGGNPQNPNSKLINDLKVFKEGETIKITKRQASDGKYYYETSLEPNKVVVNDGSKEVVLRIVPVGFTKAELDMIEQVKQVINKYDKQTLIDSIKYSFEIAGKPITQEKAERIYEQASKQ